jgi:cellulose synthase operon protein YhjU
MRYWGFYFITKAILHFNGSLHFHLYTNLLLLVLLLAPLKASWLRFRSWFSVPAAIALAYHDLPLPPIKSVWLKFSQLTSFSLEYVLELASRVFNWQLLLFMLLWLLFYAVAQRYLRMSTWVLIAIASTQFSTGSDSHLSRAQSTEWSADLPDDKELSQSLEDFFLDEKNRQVAFPGDAGGQAPFDILLINVCSLSWDDMAFVQQLDHPVMKRFQFQFTDYNTAAPYSGPSIIRLLRANLGQTPQANLYQTPEKGSLLFSQLEKAGFQTEFAMNHDGQFGGLLHDVQVLGGLNRSPFPVNSLPPYLRSFDGTTITNDFDVLEAWWRHRISLNAPRVSLFYNTISLHDGNRKAGTKLNNSVESYRERLPRLLDDISRFLDLVQGSGRRAIVVMIPEHGAAIHREGNQIAGLREIPSPDVTVVPVGLALIAPEVDVSQPIQKMTEPSSHLALATLIARFIQHSPFSSSKKPWSEYAQNLPSTKFVSQNEDVVVQSIGDRFFLRDPSVGWTLLPPAISIVKKE